MATQSSTLTALYEDVVASLIPHYDNYVLMTSPGVLSTVYNISGGLGDTVKVPVTNFWTEANTVTENGNVMAATNDTDFAPGSITIQAGKRGAGTYVTEESLEDAGLAQVRNAVLTRLSRSLAQGSDKAGFNTLASGSATALTDIANVSLDKIYAGGNVSALGTCDVSMIFSPDALIRVIKRDPTVKMFMDPSFDRTEMVATIRDGYGRVPFSRASGNAFFAQAIIGSSAIGEATASLRVGLDEFSQGVAQLRADNAPTDESGFYIATVSAAHEFHLAKELNGVGGTSSGAIGSVAQDLANQALLDGLIGQAIGCKFIRSQNVPTSLASA